MRFVNIASGVMVKFSPSVKILATYLIARNLYWCETGILLLAKIRMDARFIDCLFEKYRQKYRHL